MFDIGKILKRSWYILWNYKVLWIFALLLAISGGASNGGGGGGGGGGGSAPGMSSGRYMDQFRNTEVPEWMREFGEWVEQTVVPLFATEESTIRTIVWFIVIIFLIAIVVGLLFAFIRYPSETAVMRMVDEHETSGRKVRFGEGWRLGWNRRAWRMFLVDLVIGAPATGIILSLVAIILALGLSLADQANVRTMPGAVIGMVFAGLFIFVFALFMVVVGLLRQYVVRYTALEDSGVWESFRRGWRLFKGNLKNTIITALVLFGLGIAFGFALIVAVFLLIPAYAIMAIPGALVATIPGGIAYGITSLFASNPLPWIIAAVVAFPLFIMIAFSPLSWLGGMFAVFSSSVWTLAFKQLKATAVPPLAPPLPLPFEEPPALQ